MYQILVVEDEPPIARYICRLLENFKDDFQVTAVGENGKEGLALYKKYETDLVITDVRMPQMDGLTMYEEIKKINPKVKGLIISDFRDFEYARNGMRLGIENYLIKPVTLEQMQDNLSKLKRKFDDEREERKKEYFRNWLWGNQKSDKELMEWKSPCRLLLMQKGCLSNSRMKYLAEVRSEERGYFYEHLNEDPFVQVWAYGMEENTTVILYQGNCEKFLKKIQQEESYITVACSSLLHQSSDLRNCYKECQKLLYYGTVIGKNQILYQERFKKRKPEFSYWEEGKEILCQAIKKGNFDAVKSELVIWFDELEKQEIPQYCVERILQNIFAWAEYRRSISYEQQQDSIAEILMVARNLAEVLGGVLELLSTGWKFEEDNKIRKERSEQMINNIENYIQTHVESVFSLRDISDVFGLSQTYICRLFHNYRKQSFKDYITELKIERSKDLLDLDMQIKDVSDYLGYQDPFYFSKVFKRKTGISPSDYKNRGKNDEI